MKTWWIAIVAVVIGAWLAACGAAGARKTASEPAAQDSSAAGMTGRPTEEIRDLDAQIAQQMADLGLAPPSDAEVTDMMAQSSTPALPTASVVDSCEQPPQADGCGDVCTLADSICTNARRICDLADQLPGDDYAAQRCTAGRGSCDRAKTRCCDC
jgi:hypothetical protein